jgi:hypothetical protein
VKALISLEPGEEMELLKKHFQEFISGLMSLPINLPGTKLYQSLQASQFMRLHSCMLDLAVIITFTFGFRQKRKW